MQTLYTISVYVHVLAACAWVGSMVFFAAVVVPVLRRPEQASAAAALVRQVGMRYRVFGWACLGLLVTTGTTNLALRGVRLDTLASGAFWADGFGRALAHKLGAVALVLVLTAVHDALATRPEARRIGSWLGRATLLASFLVVLYAVWLVRGTP